jgi:PTS system nitrogen regulatory IIA component
MQLCDILSADRIVVDPRGEVVPNKDAALRQLARLIAPAIGATDDEVERHLKEREKLQSTGIGDGVAIPHTSLETVEVQAAALLLCSSGVEFDAIDRAKVNIIIGVVGPKRSTGQHLKTLARISKLLKSADMRKELVASPDRMQAYALLERRDRAVG